MSCAENVITSLYEGREKESLLFIEASGSQVSTKQAF